MSPSHPRSASWTRSLPLALVIALLLAAPAHARVYKCDTPDGRIEYSDKPCGEEVVIEDSTDFGGSVPVADPAVDDPPADAAVGAAPAPAAPPPTDSERIAAEYDQRINAVAERITDINERIAQAQTDQRSPEYLADLADQKAELRQRRESLLAEKNARLRAIDDGAGY